MSMYIRVMVGMYAKLYRHRSFDEIDVKLNIEKCLHFNRRKNNAFRPIYVYTLESEKLSVRKNGLHLISDLDF